MCVQSPQSPKYENGMRFIRNKPAKNLKGGHTKYRIASPQFPRYTKPRPGITMFRKMALIGLFDFISNLRNFCSPTASVSRKWAGRDKADLTELASA